MSLSESKRKTILWLVLVILAGALLFFYAKNVQKKLRNLKIDELKEQLKIPELKEELDKLKIQ